MGLGSSVESNGFSELDVFPEASENRSGDNCSLSVERFAEFGRDDAVPVVSSGEERVRLRKLSVRGGRFLPRPRD